MLGLRRLLNEEKIVREGDLFAIPVKRAIRNRSRARDNGYKEVVGLKGFVVVDYRGKFCGFGEDEDEILEAVRAYDREHHAFEKPYRVWETDDLVSQLPKYGALLNPAADPLTHINATIRNQTSYGFKTWPVKGTLLRWSNSQAAWSVWGTARRGKEVFGDPLKLDADMIVVPYPRTVVEPLLKKLLPLPLYANSTEGRRRDRQ